MIRRRQLLRRAAAIGPAGVAAALTGESVAAAAGVGHQALAYVSGEGNDKHRGNNPTRPMRSLQGAYRRLPPSGGTIIVGPGRYDVGHGLALRRDKPVWIIGTVRPRKYTATAPRNYPGGSAAVLHSSVGAPSLVTTLMPPVRLDGYGLRLSNLVFEISEPTTKTAVDANSVNMGEVEGCIFWAAERSAPDAVAIRVYTDNRHGDDGSWWRIHDNVAGGLALAVLGNDSGPRYNCNQHVVRENIGFGRAHTLVDARPCIRIVGGNRCVVRDNNIEGYHIGVQLQTCWMCLESADGGEMVDIFVDLLDCHGSNLSPIGISTPTTALPGAILVRGDNYATGNVITVASVFNGQPSRTYGPSALALASGRNVVVAPGAG